MTGEEHNKFVSWAFIGYAALQAMMVVVAIAIFAIVLSTDLGGPGAPPPPREFLVAMSLFVSVFYSILIAPALIAAYAVRKKKSWARVAAIIASIFTMITFPIGTMVSVYSMWFFLGDKWKEVYERDLSTTPQQLSEFDPTKWEGSFKTDDEGRAVFTPAEPPDWRS